MGFLPVALQSLSAGGSGIPRRSFTLAATLAAMSMAYGRYCSPKWIWCPMTDSVRRKIEKVPNHGLVVDGDYYLEYMNINCGHEFFPTVNVGLLHSCNQQPGFIYLPVIHMMLMGASYGPFLLMQKYSDMYVSKA